MSSLDKPACLGIAGEQVNEMFQDLAVLVNDQGHQVIKIDQAMGGTAERVKEANKELVTADRSQKAYRNRCLMIWLVAGIVVSVIIIIVFA
jgi:syntaxin 7